MISISTGSVRPRGSSRLKRGRQKQGDQLGGGGGVQDLVRIWVRENGSLDQGIAAQVEKVVGFRICD